MKKNSISNTVLSGFNRGFIFLLITCLIIQLFISFNIENILCIALVFISFYILSKYIINENIIYKVPLPAYVIVCFNLSSLSGPLIIQSIFWTPFLINLKSPLLTFSTCLLLELSLIISLYIFNNKIIFKYAAIINSKLPRALIISAPSIGQLWLMGLVGTFVYFWASKLLVQGSEYGDVNTKFALTFIVLSNAPFYIPLRHLLYPNLRPAGKSQYILLLIYFFELLF